MRCWATQPSSTIIASAELRHHGHLTLLNLSGAMVKKTSFIALLREARWIKRPLEPSLHVGLLAGGFHSRETTGTSKKPTGSSKLPASFSASCCQMAGFMTPEEKERHEATRSRR
jgi:hypothetical protein